MTPMRKSIFIHVLALLLTFVVIGEMCVAWQIQDAISMEIDADGEEEEENKEEDKLKEYYSNALHSYTLKDAKDIENEFCLVWNWTTPIIDHLTPPPRIS